jgi:hypothetical protein
MGNWITLNTFINRSEAELMKTLLEERGIPAIIRDENKTRITHNLCVSSDVDVQVHESDFKKAQVIFAPAKRSIKQTDK